MEMAYEKLSWCPATGCSEEGTIFCWDNWVDDVMSHGEEFRKNRLPRESSEIFLFLKGGSICLDFLFLFLTQVFTI